MSSAAFRSISLDSGCFRKGETTIRKRDGRKFCIRGSVASSPQSLQFAKTKTQKSEEMVRIAVLGASGYTGSEIVRLLANHPNFGITLMTADRKAGQSIGSVFPHLVTQGNMLLK